MTHPGHPHAGRPVPPPAGSTPRRPGFFPPQPEASHGAPAVHLPLPQGGFLPPPSTSSPFPVTGEALPPSSQRSRRGKKASIIGSGVGAGILFLVLFFARESFFPAVLDHNSVQSGVQKVLTEDFGIGDAAQVSCPAKQKVVPNGKFICTVSINGETKRVDVTILNDSGQYQVNQPS